MTTDSKDLTFELELECNDYELTEALINVEYEIIPEQRDVGIMREYADVAKITFYEDELNKNVEAVKAVNSIHSINWIEDRINEELA